MKKTKKTKAQKKLEKKIKEKKKLKALLTDKEENQSPAFTTTGELFQPVRIHYAVTNRDHLVLCFEKLKCIDHDAAEKRWVWLYTEESENLDFESRPEGEGSVVLGEFIFKENQEAVLNLRSVERALSAIEFFDRHIPKSAFKATDMSAFNRLFTFGEAASISSLDQFFERNDPVVKDPNKIVQELTAIKAGIDDEKEQIEAVSDFLEELSEKKDPEIEKFPLNYYEDGIAPLRMALITRQKVAFQHWQGNTGYTSTDAIREWT
ncbi:MAG: hypothetical protein GY749_50455 [Desulfobacteraceae bacterium]|nr:hypothetical protein [Desulfobacteraceae bacterium]